MERNFEQRLSESLNQDIKIPKSVFDKAEDAYKDIRSQKNQQPTKRPFWGRKRWIAAAAIVLLGVAFNKPVIAAIKSTFWGNHAGIEKAVENGYQQKIQIGSAKSQGVETNITNLVVDSSKVALAINIKLNDISAIKDIDHVYLDMVITDDNGTVIFGEGYPGTPIKGMENKTIINPKNGELIYDVLLHSPSANIPQMSKLQVQIKSISFFKDNTSPAIKKIEGDWNISIALDEQFAKTNSTAYAPQNSSKNLSIISAEMLSTGFVIKFIVNTPVDESILNKTHLVDSNGNSYNNSGIAHMERTADNKNLISMTFEVSSFDQIDSFKFSVEDINDSEVTLVKSNK